MKKSLIGLGVIAAMAVGGAANAGYFNIQDGEAPVGTGTFTGLIQTGTSASVGVTMSTLTLSGINSLAQPSADNVATALLGSGFASQTGTLVYFGVKENDLGYFGVLFIGHGASFSLSVQNASPPGNGVYRSEGPTFPAGESLNPTSGDYFWSRTVAGSGQAYLWLFTELDHKATIGGDAQAYDSSMTVQYMTYSGGSWSIADSRSGVASSALNMATFIVPVPAPALLAGLGLAGALALRRRMK